MPLARFEILSARFPVAPSYAGVMIAVLGALFLVAGVLDAPPTLSAHRFGKGEAPEGTLEALRNAAALGPEVMLEADARLTADGHVVLLHDETFSRTTGHPGRPEEMTLEEIRALDAGATFSPDHGATRPWAQRGVRVATLAEALDAAPQNRFLIDLKQPGDLVAAVLEVVRRKRALGRVIFGSFHGEALRQVRAAVPEAVTTFDLESGLRLAVALRGDWKAYRAERKFWRSMRPSSGRSASAERRSSAFGRRGSRSSSTFWIARTRFGNG